MNDKQFMGLRIRFEVGLQFSGKKQILEAVKTFAVISKKNLKIKKMTKGE